MFEQRSSIAPLTGLLVADFSRVLAGPYATMMLGDLGATIVKVERPVVGDDTRSWGPPFNSDGVATYFSGINRNKLSIALDLAHGEDLAIAKALAQRSDVLVENFRPGTLTSLGLGYDELAKENPQLIYCSISGFGHEAGADWPGYDLLVQAMGGLMSITGTTEPTKVGVALVDVVTGLHSVIAIMAALESRNRTGTGQLVQVNLLQSLLSSLVNQSAAFVQAGEVARHLGNAHPSICPYEVYRTLDAPMVLAVGNDEQFQRLAAVIDRPDIATDVRFSSNADRVLHRDALNEILNAVLVTKSAKDWGLLMAAAKVPCGPINDISQAFELASQLGLKPVNGEWGHPNAEVSNPISFSASTLHYQGPAPKLDSNRVQVLQMLGITPTQL